MQKLLLKGFVAGALLLAFSYASLWGMVRLFPEMAEQYYNPIFDMEGVKTYLFFLHPFILSFALAWFWHRFKGQFHGSFWRRGIEMGLVYGLVALLPSMWITFSSLAISLPMVATWLLYGTLQGMIAGIVYARISP